MAEQKEKKKAKLFPILKRELKNFLHDEEGIISKDKVIKAGIILSNILLMSQPAAAHNNTTHNNSLSVDYSSPTATASHSHHSSHANTQY